MDEAAQRAGACAQADPRCALVQARALFGLQKPAEAAAALAPAVERLGVLEAHGQALLGEARLLAGDAKGALQPLRRAIELADGGPAGSRAAALLADALLAGGDPQAALAAAGEANEQVLPADLQAGLAHTHAAALAALASAPGAKKTARREAALAARAFWLKWPAHPAADQARLDEAKLAKLPPPAAHDLSLRASRLLTAGMPAAAVESAREAVAAAKPAERAEANSLLARSLIAAGARDQATQALRIAWLRGDAHLAPQAGLLLARDRARHGKRAEAIAIADALARKFPRSNEAPDAQLLAARLAEEDGRAAESHRRMEALARGSSSRAADARWLLAWERYKKGEGAAAAFAEYARRAADPSERARGLYWSARAGADDAPALYEEAASLDPLGFYGALASAALGRAESDVPAFPPAPSPAPPPPEGPPAAASGSGQAAADGAPDGWDLARALASLGLCAEASAELDLLIAHGHRGPAVLRALPLFEACQRFDRSVQLAQTALLHAGEADRRALLGFAYPAAFAPSVERAARRARLDPYLLLSVARRESVFKPDAHSAAGAVGLVQLLPKTAARIAAVLGRPAPDRDALAEPEAALDLGAWYFAELYGSFGDVAIAAAAYNAGPGAVRKWLQGAAGKPLDEWMEEIPFRETRHYVRAVVGAWSAYRKLAGGGAPLLQKTVPVPRAGIEF